MKCQEVCREIREIIALLVREGLSDHQHYPETKKVGSQTQIGIPNNPSLAISLKSESYNDMYSELRKAEAYHIRMLDGALIQFLYTFEGREIQSHRVAFFPAPMLEMFDAIPEDYNSDEVFAEIVGEFSVKFPFRFDFNKSDDAHIDVDHPKSHLTLGQYKGCRIPITAPITPKRFMRFTLRNFYNPAYYAVDLDKQSLRHNFPDSITDAERKIFHAIT